MTLPLIQGHTGAKKVFVVGEHLFSLETVLVLLGFIRIVM